MRGSWASCVNWLITFYTGLQRDGHAIMATQGRQLRRDRAALCWQTAPKDTPPPKSSAPPQHALARLLLKTKTHLCVCMVGRHAGAHQTKGRGQGLLQRPQSSGRRKGEVSPRMRIAEFQPGTPAKRGTDRSPAAQRLGSGSSAPYTMVQPGAGSAWRIAFRCLGCIRPINSPQCPPEPPPQTS